MSLSYRSFLDLLEATPRDWFLSPGGAIRRVSTTKGCVPTQECPICALHEWLTMEHYVAAVDLGLEMRLGWAIADAADKIDGYDESIRADLLDACGLPREDLDAPDVDASRETIQEQYERVVGDRIEGRLE